MVQLRMLLNSSLGGYFLSPSSMSIPPPTFGPSTLPPGARVSLPQLPAGAAARVTAVEAEPDDATRLKALGLCVGRQVLLVKAGDPLVVRVLGARVGISARLAVGVLVEAD